MAVAVPSYVFETPVTPEIVKAFAVTVFPVAAVVMFTVVASVEVKVIVFAFKAPPTAAVAAKRRLKVPEAFPPDCAKVAVEPKVAPSEATS